MRGLYSLLLYLGLPLVLARLYWRGRRAPEYRRRWGERLGFVEPLPGAGGIWIHAVSVGETRAALPLARALRERYPQAPLLITTTTPTGSRQVRDAFGETVAHVYAPYDLPDAVNRFLDRTRPRLGVIMETELWPNLFYACELRGIPLIVANARLSERSARGYARFAGLSRQTLARTAVIAAQAEADAARFRALGAPRVQVTGNLKYDLTLPEDLAECGAELRRALGVNKPILIAASTHAGEEEPVLDAFAELRRTRPELRLVLVPRHPERFAGVAELCAGRGLRVIRRSEGRPCDPATDVFLGDTMGELLLFFAAADVAFVGGSLVEVGGHNVMEPALLGLPVLFGPHMFNFADASRQLLEAQAAWQVADAAELAATAAGLFAAPARRQAAGRRGRQVVENNRGALAALLAIIAGVLAAPGADRGARYG